MTKVQKIVAEFHSLPDWESKYKRIIEIGKALPEMSKELKTEDNKVRGCQSQVWLHAHFEDGKIIFVADSDSAIVKGLIALLVQVYSDLTPQEILAQSPDFIQELGLNANLSQARANGLVSMIKQIKFYALAYSAR